MLAVARGATRLAELAVVLLLRSNLNNESISARWVADNPSRFFVPNPQRGYLCAGLLDRVEAQAEPDAAADRGRMFAFRGV